DLVVGRLLGVGRDAVAVVQGAVLPEAPHVVEDDGLVGAVQAADGVEGVAVLLGVGPVLLLQRLAADQRLALHAVQPLTALLGADLLEEAVVGRVLLVHHVVGGDVGDDAVHVLRVEALVVGGGHAALGAAGGDPLLGVDLLQRLEDAVLVAGGLPDVQLGPVGRLGPGRGEEAVLHGDLVAVHDLGRLAAAGRRGDAVAAGVEDGRPADVLVQHGDPLLEGARGGAAVIDRLGVVEDEEAVTGVRLLLDQAHAGYGEQPFLDVGGAAVGGAGGLRLGGGGRARRAHGAYEHRERQQPSERLAHAHSPVRHMCAGS